MKKSNPNKNNHSTKSSYINVYGKNVVDQALEKVPTCIKCVYLTERFSDSKLLAKIRRLGCPVLVLVENKMPEGVRQSDNHQGVVAQLDPECFISTKEDFLFTISDSPLVLVLSEIQDPQNVGAMIRSAVAFGVDAVVLPEHRQVPVTGIVAKVSAGMVFSIPIIMTKNVNTTLQTLKKHKFTVYGLAGDGDTSLYKTQIDGPTVLVVGNEGTGLREKTRSICDELIRIPIAPQCESLNAASAVTATLAVLRSR